MTWPNDYHIILMDDYPEVHELWCEAVNADFGAEDLYEQGKTEEADALWKIHEEKWAEYMFITKIIFTGWKDEKTPN